MKSSLFSLTCFLVISLCSNIIHAQARLNIFNDSGRHLTVKVMKSGGKGGKLHEEIQVPAQATRTVYFTEKGKYFTKTKATLEDRPPICRKGQSFKIISGSKGYTVMNITFSISESVVPMASGGVSITEEEFNRD